MSAGPEFDRVVGKRIRDERRRVRLTQERLAERAGLSTNYIAQLERGRKGASLRTLARLAAALGLPPAALVAVAARAGGTRGEDQLRCLAVRLGGLGAAQRDLVLRLAETVERWEARRRPRRGRA